MKLPGTFKKGIKYWLDGGLMNDWRDAILADRIIAGTGIKETSAGKAGRILSVDKITLAAKPLTLKKGTADNKIQVISGTVNLVVPTLSGTALDHTTPPELTITGNTYVWLKCVGTFGDPDTYVVTIETSASTTPPSGTVITATGFTSFWPIGWVAATTYAITNYGGGNRGVDSFGNVNQWWLQ